MGWYFDSDFEKPVFFPFAISDNTTLYARWQFLAPQSIAGLREFLSETATNTIFLVDFGDGYTLSRNNDIFRQESGDSIAYHIRTNDGYYLIYRQHSGAPWIKYRRPAWPIHSQHLIFGLILTYMQILDASFNPATSVFTIYESIMVVQGIVLPASVNSVQIHDNGDFIMTLTFADDLFGIIEETMIVFLNNPDVPTTFPQDWIWGSN